jgi:hypothetical protein
VLRFLVGRRSRVLLRRCRVLAEHSGDFRACSRTSIEVNLPCALKDTEKRWRRWERVVDRPFADLLASMRKDRNVPAPVRGVRTMPPD